MPELVLEHGAWRAALRPEAGGLIAGLWHDGIPMLRAMAEGTCDPFDAACFPMVPWCNRIADGHFRWHDTAIQLPRNFPPERHSIHGLGWQSSWTVEALGAAACTMIHSHAGASPGWPWAYLARQSVALTQEGCTITLALTNLSDRLMPAGIGLHPYLRRRPESRVAFQAGPVIDVGADMIPSGALLRAEHFGDFSAEGGTLLPKGTVIDHCYTVWNGAARVSDDCGTISLSGEGAGSLHLFASGDGSILCLEPVNHLPDAANSGAMPLAAPGETVSMTLRIGAG